MGESDQLPGWDEWANPRFCLLPDGSRAYREPFVRQLFHMMVTGNIAEIERLWIKEAKKLYDCRGAEIKRLEAENAYLGARLDTITIPVPNAETVERLEARVNELEGGILGFLAWENEREHDDREWLEQTERLAALLRSDAADAAGGE